MEYLVWQVLADYGESVTGANRNSAYKRLQRAGKRAGLSVGPSDAMRPLPEWFWRYRGRIPQKMRRASGMLPMMIFINPDGSFRASLLRRFALFVSGV